MDFSSVDGHATGFISPPKWPAASQSGLHNEMTVADCWFAALDQRPFTSGNRLWTTRVVGVHLEGLHTWIQLEFAEHPGSSFLLHLTPWAGLLDAVNIIRGEMLRGQV